MSRHRRQRNRRERLSRWRGERLLALFDEYLPRIWTKPGDLVLARLDAQHALERGILSRRIAARRRA
jgi:hypothetical protein